MPDVQVKSLRDPDETITLPGVREDVVDVGDFTVGRVEQDVGWRWSTHVRPIVGGEWCQARHVGVLLSGRLAVELRDGTHLEFAPDDVYDIPPGHDGWTLGDEPMVAIEWSGVRTFAGGRTGFHGRVLATILFTDLVGSTHAATAMGDVAWREVLARHYEVARAAFDRFRGQEVTTTGDGMLATFEGPGAALACADSIRGAAEGSGLHVRIGVHVGEVTRTATGVHGVALHEAARVMAEAGRGEILVSEITMAVGSAVGLRFASRGRRQLKGIGERELFSYEGSAADG